jgi:hypothetical protein
VGDSERFVGLAGGFDPVGPVGHGLIRPVVFAFLKFLPGNPRVRPGGQDFVQGGGVVSLPCGELEEDFLSGNPADPFSPITLSDFLLYRFTLNPHERA